MSTTWASKIVAELVADEVVHRLHVELCGEAVLDAVDDRQLGGALVGLGQEPLGLVEQAGVLEGDAEAGGEGVEQPDVRVAEGVLAVEVLERDDGRATSSPTIRGAHNTALAGSPWTTGRLPELGAPRRIVVDDAAARARLDELAPESR